MRYQVANPVEGPKNTDDARRCGQGKYATSKLQEGELTVSKVLIHTAGIEFKEPLNKPEWLELVSEVYARWRCSNFQMADALNHGVQQWGEKYVFAQQIFRREYGTLRNICSIGNRIPLSRRRDNLHFSHHEVVAALPLEEQDKYLSEAESQSLTVSDLRELIRTSKSQVLPIPQTEESSGEDLISWFSDGFRFVRGATDWPASQRRAFQSEWRRLCLAVGAGGLG
jgi:hypothetical protein